MEIETLSHFTLAIQYGHLHHMIKTFLPYPGAKNKLLPRIVAAIDKHKFDEYREPFLGGGAIGLHYATEKSMRSAGSTTGTWASTLYGCSRQSS